MKDKVHNVHDTKARSIKGTGKHNAFACMSNDTEWSNEFFLFTAGGPIDAPEVMPAGCVTHQAMHNSFGDKWNVPVQLLCVRN